MQHRPSRATARGYLAIRLLFGAMALTLVLVCLIPNVRLGNHVWVRNASPEALVENSERVLRFPFGNYYDACFYLGDAGTRRSKVVIQAWLRRRGITHSNDSFATNSCQDALRRIAQRYPDE